MKCETKLQCQTGLKQTSESRDLLEHMTYFKRALWIRVALLGNLLVVVEEIGYVLMRQEDPAIVRRYAHCILSCLSGGHSGRQNGGQHNQRHHSQRHAGM